MLKNPARSAALILSLLAPSGLAAQTAENAAAAANANNPIANTEAVNFQDQYFGNLTGVEQELNQFFFRYAAPFSAFGGDWLARYTFPVVTAPDGTGGLTTGFGDLNVLAAYLFDTGNPAISFGIGPQVTVPSASEDQTGSGKWSVGLANVLFNATNPRFQWGYLLTWQASIAGDDDRKDVNLGAAQPFLFYQLGQGWYLRSSAIATYDFTNDNYTLPVGLGVGKVIKTDFAVVNLFAEPQYSVATRGDGQPEWGVFAGLNFQF
ncbi:hypothetical protein [Oceanomicrobium pacificus]|uniref:Transporter n=1 Tax=Oceanomicrobium pacificus TaxID=2692916 RepID=A0A6B0TN90_9RHOB|nr:hypothetical protein [Oceanomicrobium pacificus]MXU66007.1 hypothetical protein [Oceanomicrobium pacificus]